MNNNEMLRKINKHENKDIPELREQLDNIELEKANKIDLNNTNIALVNKADKNYVDAEISKKLDNSPKGAYPTLNDLKIAFPSGTNGVYLVQENGHIYSWNGSWIDLGEYRSNLTDLSELKVNKEKYYSKNMNDVLDEVSSDFDKIKNEIINTTYNMSASDNNFTAPYNTVDNSVLKYQVENKSSVNTIFLNGVTVTGNNLLDIGKCTRNKYVDETTGLIKSAEKHYATEYYIEVTPNTHLTLSNKQYGVNYSRIVFYDENKVFISGVFLSGLKLQNTVSVPSNAKYVRTSSGYYTNEAEINYLQLEYGTVANDFCKYKNTKSITNNIKINKASDSKYGSDILYSDGWLYKVFNTISIDGSLNWYEGTHTSTQYLIYTTGWTNKNEALYDSPNSGFASNEDLGFEVSTSNATNRINIYENNNLMITIEKSYIDNVTGDNVLSKFKNYITNKPILLTYRYNWGKEKNVKVNLEQLVINKLDRIRINSDVTPFVSIDICIQKQEEKTDVIQLEKAGFIHKGGNYYTSFGGGVMVNGKEYHIFRCASKHTTVNGNYGYVVAYIKDRAGNWTVKNLGNLGLIGGEFRDINLSLPYDGTNDIILSGAFYTGVSYNYRNYVFRLSENLEVKWYEEIIGSEGLFSWGNYLFSPTGVGLKCAYDQNFSGTNKGVFLFRKTNPESNIYESVQLFPPSMANPNECSIGYHGDKLFCIVRQANDYSLYRCTTDLSGASGWSEPIKLPFKAHAPNIPCYTPKDKPMIFTFSSVTDELVSQTERFHRDISITATFDGIEWHKEKIMIENNHYGGYNTFIKNDGGYGMCYYDDYDNTKDNYRNGTDLFYKQIHIEQYLTELDYLEWRYKNK